MGIRKSHKRLVHGLLAGILLASVLVLAWHNVPTALSHDDRTAAQEILERAGYDRAWRSKLDLATYDDQVEAIIAVQDAVLKASPNDTDIPMNMTREPADLLRMQMGFCFDRSRAIEKILAMLGFETRHIAVYSTKKTGSALVSLLTPQIMSHAVSEVKTSKGWMVVDSNDRWIGLTRDNLPVAMDRLRKNSASAANWSARNEDRVNPIFTDEFTYVIGLYSRHGRFFPPYTRVPDVNWRDFVVANIFG